MCQKGDNTITKEEVLKILDDLREGVNYMRENGESDLRTVLFYIDEAKEKVEKGGEIDAGIYSTA